jgi:hypothetical protein
MSVLTPVAMVPFVVGASDGAPPAASIPGACPALPDGALIANLTSGQAVSSGQTVTLRFSSKAFTCGDWSNDVDFADCHDWWSFNLTVPADAIAPGVHKLAEIGTSFGDLVNTLHMVKGDGCKKDRCEGGSNGIGTVPVVAPAATLEIDAVTETCITGKVSGLVDPDFASAPNFNGVFYALRCP